MTADGSILRALAVALVRSDVAGDEDRRWQLVDWRMALLRGALPEDALRLCAGCGAFMEGMGLTCSTACRQRVARQKVRASETATLVAAVVASPERLAAACRRAGLSYRELARRLGVHRSVVDHWMAGRRPVGECWWAGLAALLGLHAAEDVRTPAGCAKCPTMARGRCMSCAQRAAWAAGRYAQRATPRRGDAWTPDESRRLAELAGRFTAAEIADVLAREFPDYPRTAAAVSFHAQEMGVSLFRVDLSLQEVAVLVGHTNSDAIRRDWLAPGLLPVRRLPSGHYRIREADLQAFIRAHPWAVEPQRMPKGHPLRSYAELAHRAQPWRGYADLASYLRVSPAQVRQWIAEGLIPARRRVGYAKGVKRDWRIRAADFGAIAEALADRLPARERRAA